MAGETEAFNLNKVNESINGLNDKLSGLQKNIIDDNLDKLDVGNKAGDIMGKLGKILDVNLFGLGTAGSLLGIKMFDINKYKNKKGGIWSLIFKKYGGIEGLHKKYLEETLTTVFEDQPEKQKAVGDLYAAYTAEVQSNKVTDALTDPDSLNVICGLGMDDKTPKAIVDKLPPVKFSSLVDKTFAELQKDDKLQYLDPTVLSLAGYSAPTKQGPKGTLIIDTDKWDVTKIDRAVIERYLADKAKELAGDVGFMKYIQSSDHFALSLMGGFFVTGSTFPNAVLLGVKTFADFGATVPEKKDVVSGSTEVLDMKEEKITEELTKVKSPLTAKMVIDAATKHNVAISYIMAIMKNDSGYGTAGLAVTTHNPGNVGNMDDGSKKDRGTRESGVDAVAKNLKTRIDAYQIKYGSDKKPNLEELASGKKADTGEKFFGVYMTAVKGPDIVQNFQQELAQAA